MGEGGVADGGVTGGLNAGYGSLAASFGRGSFSIRAESAVSMNRDQRKRRALRIFTQTRQACVPRVPDPVDWGVQTGHILNTSCRAHRKHFLRAARCFEHALEGIECART